MFAKKQKPVQELAGRTVRINTRYSFTDFLFVCPAILLLLITTYYPVLELFNISFTNWNLIKDTRDYVGLKNWIWLFTSPVGTAALMNTLWVTLVYTAGNIAIVLVGGILMALLFNRLTKPYAFMRAVVFMPRYIAMSTAGVIFLWMMNKDYGILNSCLSALGVQDKIGWVENRSTAMISVLILTGWHGIGYGMMIYLSAMLGISKDYYEAASLDGASGFASFRYITLPLLSPTTLFLFITTFISSMKVFQSIDVLTGGGPYQATEVIVYYIYRLAFTDSRVDRAAVVSIFFFVILLIITASTLRITNKNVHYEA